MEQPGIFPTVTTLSILDHTYSQSKPQGIENYQPIEACQVSGQSNSHPEGSENYRPIGECHVSSQPLTGSVVVVQTLPNDLMSIRRSSVLSSSSPTPVLLGQSETDPVLDFQLSSQLFDATITHNPNTCSTDDGLKIDRGQVRDNVGVSPQIDTTDTDIGQVRDNVGVSPQIGNTDTDIGQVRDNVGVSPQIDITDTDIGQVRDVGVSHLIDTTDTDIGRVRDDIGVLPQIDTTDTDIGLVRDDIGVLPQIDTTDTDRIDDTDTDMEVQTLTRLIENVCEKERIEIPKNEESNDVTEEISIIIINESEELLVYDSDASQVTGSSGNIYKADCLQSPGITLDVGAGQVAAEVDQVLDLFPFICGFCYKQYNRIDKYYEHIYSHEENKDEYFHVCNVDDKLGGVTNTEQARAYYCGVCNQVFTRMCHLHEHVIQEEKLDNYIYNKSTRTVFKVTPTSDISKDKCRTRSQQSFGKSRLRPARQKKSRRKNARIEPNVVEILKNEGVSFSDGDRLGKPKVVTMKKINDTNSGINNQTEAGSQIVKSIEPKLFRQNYLTSGMDNRPEPRILTLNKNGDSSSGIDNHSAEPEVQTVMSTDPNMLTLEDFTPGTDYQIEAEFRPIMTSKRGVLTLKKTNDLTSHINDQIQLDEIMSTEPRILILKKKSDSKSEIDNQIEDECRPIMSTEPGILTLKKTNDLTSHIDDSIELEFQAMSTERDNCSTSAMDNQTEAQILILKKNASTSYDRGIDNQTELQFQTMSSLSTEPKTLILKKNASASGIDNQTELEFQTMSSLPTEPKILRLTKSLDSKSEIDNQIKDVIQTNMFTENTGAYITENPHTLCTDYDGSKNLCLKIDKSNGMRDKCTRQSTSNPAGNDSVVDDSEIWKKIEKRQLRLQKQRDYWHRRGKQARKKAEKAITEMADKVIDGSEAGSRHADGSKNLCLKIDKSNGMRDKCTRQSTSNPAGTDSVVDDSEIWKKTEKRQLRLQKQRDYWHRTGKQARRKAEKAITEMADKVIDGSEAGSRHADGSKNLCLKIDKSNGMRDKCTRQSTSNPAGTDSVVDDSEIWKKMEKRQLYLQKQRDYWHRKGKQARRKAEKAIREMVDKVVDGGEAGGRHADEVASKTTEFQISAPNKKKRVKHYFDVQCHICGKMYKNDRMASHLALHTGIRPHVCPICHKDFRTKKALCDHSICHRSERKFVCDICGKMFKIKGNLRQHRETHTAVKDIPCLVCGQMFNNKFILKAHMHRHSDVKAHSCDICGMTFKRIDQVSRHKYKHSDHRPFQCTLCEKAFKLGADLNKHTRRVHKQ